MRIQSFHNSKRGFTFLELLLALAILSIGLTHIFRIFFGSINALVHTRNRINASLMLDEVHLELIRNIGQITQKGELSIKDEKGTNPTFNSVVTLTPRGGLRYLYIADMIVSWKEGRVNKEIGRTVYVRTF